MYMTTSGSNHCQTTLPHRKNVLLGGRLTYHLLPHLMFRPFQMISYSATRDLTFLLTKFEMCSIGLRSEDLAVQDVVIFQKLMCCSSGMTWSIILCQFYVSVSQDMRDKNWPKNVILIPSCCKTINDTKKQRFFVDRDSRLEHDLSASTKSVHYLNTNGAVAFSSPAILPLPTVVTLQIYLGFVNKKNIRIASSRESGMPLCSCQTRF